MPRLRPTILALAFAVLASRASACILEFRSSDWQVAQSPLVIVGTVTQVTPTPLAADVAPLFASGLTKPATATVAIQRIVKGSLSAKTITVSSGPIRSCNPYPVHLSFSPNKSYIFILTPTADGYQLAWAGSLLEMSDLPLVQDSFARCDTWRTDYLSRVAATAPETLRAAQSLNITLTANAKSWPIRSEDSLTPSELLHGLSDDPATTRATDAALALLSAATPAAVQTALALDFNQPNGWSHHPLWTQIRLRYTEAQAADILALNESEWSRLLGSATTAEQREKYFSRVAADPPTLAFPTPAPDPLPNLHGDTLTTDFLLRAQTFDRGDLYFNYGMQADALATLNTKRLTSTLPALYNSKNDHLQWAAVTALAEMPNDDFVALQLPHLIASDPMPLADLQPGSLIEKHLLALLDYANAHASPDDLAKIWTRLTAAQCFTPAIRSRTSATSGPAVAAYQQAADTYAKSSHSLFETTPASP